MEPVVNRAVREEVRRNREMPEEVIRASELVDGILILLLFTLPGQLSVYIRSSMSNVRIKRDEWQARIYQFIAFSLTSWYAFHWFTRAVSSLSRRLLNKQIAPVNVTLTSITGQYLSVPIWLIVVVIGAVLGALLGLADIWRVHERLFGAIRKRLGMNPENRGDVWTETILPRKSFLANVTFTDGRDLWGVVTSASNKEEERALYMLPVKYRLDDVKACLPPSMGVYVDLEKGYTIELFDARSVRDELARRKAGTSGHRGVTERDSPTRAGTVAE